MSNGTIGAVFLGFMLIIIAVYTAPVVEDATLDMRIDTVYNCANDPTYNSSLDTNKMGCGITSMTSPLYVMAAIFAAITMIMASWKTQPEQLGPGY